MHITLVKKILETGKECKKCIEVSDRLKENNEIQLIDKVVYADARDVNSEGFVLAQKHKVDVAPFFIVEDKGETTIYKSYMQLRKNVFGNNAEEEKGQEEDKQADPNEDLYWM